MGTFALNEPELIRLTAVDFFSNEVLVSDLVKPSVAMLHYNTKYSGVSRSDMVGAERSRTCIFGRDAARERFMYFLGPDTTISVHGGQSDFTAIRWITPKVVDTSMLAGYEHGKIEGGRSLMNLSFRKPVDRCRLVRKGHFSLKDARATRESRIGSWSRSRRTNSTKTSPKIVEHVGEIALRSQAVILGFFFSTSSLMKASTLGLLWEQCAPGVSWTASHETAPPIR